MVKPKFSEPAKNWWVFVPFCTLDSLEQSLTQLQEPPNHRHYPMISISAHQHTSLSFVQITLFPVIPSCTNVLHLSVSPKMQPLPQSYALPYDSQMLEVWRNISCFDNFHRFSSLVGFSPSTHPAHPHLHLICVVSGTFLYVPCFKWLSNRTKLWPFLKFLVYG